MRDTPEGIKEELRAAAQFAESEADEGGFDPMTVASEAVELIEHYEGALKRIAEGETPADTIATEALDALKFVTRR